MAEVSENFSVSEYVLVLLGQGQDREQITTDLLQKGHDERFVQELLHETIKLRNAKMRTQGLTLILIGAVVCLLSFVLSITSSATHLNFPLVLYGLTSVGIIIVFAGFMKIF